MQTPTFRVFKVTLLCVFIFCQTAHAQKSDTKTSSLVPVYPAYMNCGKISSPFGSMKDLDGSLRNAPHVGIDLGNLGDVVIAPADGKIEAVWQVEHEWGGDWNLLLAHTAADLNITDSSVIYYTEFDHLQQKDMKNLVSGGRIQQGEPIGVVRHPGNNTLFRAELHMEVYVLPVSQHLKTEWREKDGIKYWWNAAAELIDPLAFMAFHMPQITDHRVDLVMYSSGNFPSGFPGFVYPLLCD